MGKGTILRIPEGVMLPTQVMEALEEKFPGAKKEYYLTTPNYAASYQSRVRILERGFQFLAEAYPTPQNKIPQHLLHEAASWRKWYDQVSFLLPLKKYLHDINGSPQNGVNFLRYLLGSVPSPQQLASFNKSFVEISGPGKTWETMEDFRTSFLALLPGLEEHVQRVEHKLMRLLQETKIINVSSLQHNLERFVIQLTDAIAVTWNVSKDDAVELLNEAEQYVIQIDGRDDIVTVSDLNSASQSGGAPRKGMFATKRYVVQYDRMLPPYYDQILEEIELIRKNNFPKTPSWPWLREAFIGSQKYAYEYFLSLKTCSATQVLADIKHIEEFWNKAKKDAFSFKKDVEAISADKNTKPSWFNQLPKYQQAFIQGLVADKQLEISPQLFIEKIIKELRAATTIQVTAKIIGDVPLWYWVLPQHQQYFIQHLLQEVPDIRQAFSSLSSRNRMVPMPANFASHKCYLLTAEGEWQALYDQALRFSHISSRDGINQWPKEVQEYHAQSNLQHVIRYTKPSKLIYLQTLITPIGKRPIIPIRLPDYELHYQAQEAIKETPEILQSNHSVNLGQYILYTIWNDDEKNFLEAVEKDAKKIPGLKELIKDYKEVLNSGAVSIVFDELKQGKARELYLAAMKHTIILLHGANSIGSCVSGKDRKAIQLLITDAIFLFYLVYNRWPKLHDKSADRNNFIEIFVSLYLTGHHQHHAGQNAPGSEGIKTPDNYLARDIISKLTSKKNNSSHSSESRYSVKDEDRLASNNEVKKIVPNRNILSKIWGGTDNSTLFTPLEVAYYLGQETCSRLLADLSAILNQEKLFTPRANTLFNPTSPTGIKNIKKIVENLELSSVDRVIQLLNEIESRPKDDVTRTKATQKIYCLRELIDKQLDEIVTHLNSILNDLKRLSKTDPTTSSKSKLLAL
ncbi:MAG: hypothetical protein BGO90_04840 [Legionella sp. 40-6]|nr:hypothetical protein [Legionella sp.]OJY13259.1 MAG: hypothetical protein BGO90_04840 [Legionella sp. 40-6]